MANRKELELERNAILQDMAVKIDFIYSLLSQATIQQEEPKSERKNSKKTKKAE